MATEQHCSFGLCRIRLVSRSLRLLYQIFVGRINVSHGRDRDPQAKITSKNTERLCGVGLTTHTTVA